MNSSWEKVKDFHVKFNHPIKEVPEILNKERVEKRLLWMQEELDEFRDADTIIDQADALIDLIYFALGTFVEMGIKPEKIFELVHISNMQKLFPDGKVRYNSDGKTIKPPVWKGPEDGIEEEIQKQLLNIC